MNIVKIRNEIRNGRTIFDLPLRVTFYARVSTDRDEQLNSLENQVQYYTELIQSKRNWSYVPGYIDEGISGTSTKKRDSFLRMIQDAKDGRFDFIITKEISRFSRSTLDSIQYTQELLEHDVGVLFQNDNINTLDPDSEFRLVVMAGVAQDEVRKLSERLKFGFRQAIKNGHVLGNDRLWGYNKSGCVLTVNETEAQAVRRIFDLYANQQLGIRRISQILFDEGFTSRQGNAFNVLTIRHILCNPKYKGWYCGSKSQTVDYRSKRKVFLDESEWVMYPDPSVPAIVSEELWDRANALYKARSKQMQAHASGADFHNRYPYSGKIICEEHGTSYHRQLYKTQMGSQEVWQCRVYRDRGRAGCSSPQLWTSDLNQIMARIFEGLVQDKEAVINAVMKVIEAVPNERDFRRESVRVEEELQSLEQKKDRLLDLSISGAINTAEFKKRNDGFNDQMQRLELQLAEMRQEEEKSRITQAQMQEIRSALERKLRLIAAQHPLVLSAPNTYTVLLDVKQLRMVDDDQCVKLAGHCAEPPQKIHICIHMLCIIAGNARADDRPAPAKPAAFQIGSIFRQHLKFRIRNFGNFRAVAVMDSLFDRRIGMPHYPVAHQAVSAPLLRRYPRGLHRLFLPALRLFRLWFAF